MYLAKIKDYNAAPKYLHRGQLTDKKHATRFPTPDAASKSADMFMKQRLHTSVTIEKVDK